jgi:hypothetical protein
VGGVGALLLLAQRAARRHGSGSRGHSRSVGRLSFGERRLFGLIDGGSDGIVAVWVLVWCA